MVAGHQKKLLALGIDRILSENRSLASGGEPPLVESACLESLKTMYAESGSSAPAHLLEAGDAYSGNRSKESAQFLDYWRSGAGNSSGGQKRGQSNRDRGSRTRDDRPSRDSRNKSSRSNDKEDIIKTLCRNFNKGDCRLSESSCKFKHRCSRVVKHGSKQWVCQGGHPSASCRQ